MTSYRNMLAKRDTVPEEENEQRRILYGLPFPDVSDAQLLERYRRHNAEVRQYFSDRGDDLLEVDWSRGDGWNELCGFVGKPVPSIPFPHANRGRYAKRGIWRWPRR